MSQQKNKQGFFISFEGGEAAGKSTQIQKLADALTEKGHDIVLTREPGGTPAAEEIRTLLSHPIYGGQWSDYAELLLLFAARAEHIKHVIQPALNTGKIVLSDRYIDSTRAYQGGLHNIPKEQIAWLEETIVGDVIPDLTFIFDLPIEAIKTRLAERGAHDHYDRQSDEQHEILRQAFLDIAKEEPQRCILHDATQDIETIATSILSAVEERLS